MKMVSFGFRQSALARRKPSAFTLIESAVMLIVLSVWSVLTYAVVIKEKANQGNASDNPSAQILEPLIIEEPLINEEPEPATRAETVEDLAPVEDRFDVESR